jgi:hypothetical protein
MDPHFGQDQYNNRAANFVPFCHRHAPNHAAAIRDSYGFHPMTSFFWLSIALFTLCFWVLTAAAILG